MGVRKPFPHLYLRRRVVNPARKVRKNQHSGWHPQLEDGKNLRERIDGQPQPEYLCGAAQSDSNFVQLQVREVQVVEGSLMEELSVLACASEPGGDGGLTGAEDPFGSRKIQPFGQRSEHHGDLVRGCFQTIQRCVAPGSERCMTGRASKGLDPFGLAMLAIPKKPHGCAHL